MATSIQTWLSEVGMSQYAQAFEANDIDFAVLVDIDDRALQEIGVTSLGHRVRLLKAVAELRAVHGPAPALRVDPALTPPLISRAGGERRQVTVLFCDMVGFTELTSRHDPEVLQDLVRHYEDVCSGCVTRYEGYVFQRLGDGIVAFFGYPRAHEGEAERAIHAALAIIDSLSASDLPDIGSVRVRIGIATGVVVISESRGAVGDTMNLAARLQSIAPVGNIVVSERVHRLAGAAFQYEDLGEHVLKGIAKPFHVYRVAAVSRAASRFEAATQEGLTPLVGREHEVGLLLERYALAKDGAGQAVLLSGEPGIGKSRVVRTMENHLKLHGAQALRFQCSPYHSNSAYHPIRDHLERELELVRNEPAEAKLDKLEALMVGRHALARGDVRFLATMLSIPCEARYGPISITPQKHKDETSRVLLALIAATARRYPTVLLLEDAHWADPTTLELLDRLIDRVQRQPLCIVVTHRPGFEPSWRSNSNVTAFSLPRLTRAQSSTIVSALAGSRVLPTEVREQILARTDGVPLYVEELTKAIVESLEASDVGDDVDYASAARRVTIPSTLRDSLMARLDRSLPAKEIAKIGAAIGREFSYELVAAVAPQGRPALDQALQQLTDAGLVFQTGTPPAATYVFKHALVQDVAYDSSLKAQRQGLHAKIAAVLEERFPQAKESQPELLAHHLTAAGETVRAARYWYAAGKLALTRLALNEAISHLNHGVQLIGTLPQSLQRDEQELQLRSLLGTAWVALRGFAAAEAWASFHRALKLAKALERHDALLPIYFGLCSNLVLQGRLADGLDWVNEMLASAEAGGDTDLWIMGHRSACTTYFWLGDFDRSREHGDRALTRYSEGKHRHLADATNVDPKTIVEIYRGIGTWIVGYPDQALQVHTAMEAHARRRNHPFDLGYALTFGSQVWDLRREPGPLLARVEEAERLGQAQSLPFISEVLAQILRGVAHLRAGRPAESVAQLRAALDKWTAGGALLWMPYLRAVLAEGLALSGNDDDALRLIEESLDQISRPGWEERSHLAEVLRLKGWILQQQDKLAAAEDSYLASLDVARVQRAKAWELRTATSLARLWQRQGRADEAGKLLAGIYGWFTEGFSTADLLDAKALLDELT